MKVNLWFARENDDEIVGILNSNSDNEYSCPICSSKVIPKAVESNKVTPHFAHIDVSKCSSEAMIHWWYKNKFIERGDTFRIFTDEEIEFTCKDFNTEVTYQLDSGTYRPDLVIYTECGQEVVFEMANSNKKKVQDYIDKWIELDRIVVEVDIKTLQSEDGIKVLKAMYYKGKCFNFNKRDGGYYNTIGKLKEEMQRNGKYDIDLVRKLDWFWKDLMKYESGVSDISLLSKTIDEIMSISYKHYDLVNSILKKSSCSSVKKDYKWFKSLDNSVVYPFPHPETYIKEIISEVNSKFKKLDDRFELRIKSITIPIYETYFNGSRKYMYKSRIVDKEYSFEINFYNKKKKVSTIPITNRFDSLANKKEYITNSAVSAMCNFKHKCTECNRYFSIEEGELKFFISKSYSLPKRCKPCREKRKLNKRKDDF